MHADIHVDFTCISFSSMFCRLAAILWWCLHDTFYAVYATGSNFRQQRLVHVTSVGHFIRGNSHHCLHCAYAAKRDVKNSGNEWDSAAESIFAIYFERYGDHTLPLVMAPFCQLIDGNASRCDYRACADQRRRIPSRHADSCRSPFFRFWPGLGSRRIGVKSGTSQPARDGCAALIAFGHLAPTVHVVAPSDTESSVRSASLRLFRRTRTPQRLQEMPNAAQKMQ